MSANRELQIQSTLRLMGFADQTLNVAGLHRILLQAFDLKTVRSAERIVQSMEARGLLVRNESGTVCVRGDRPNDASELPDDEVLLSLINAGHVSLDAAPVSVP